MVYDIHSSHVSSHSRNIIAELQSIDQLHQFSHAEHHDVQVFRLLRLGIIQDDVSAQVLPTIQFAVSESGSLDMRSNGGNGIL